MKERIKQIIVEQTLEQSKLKLMLRNLAIIGELTDEKSNEILDKIADIQDTIQKLEQYFKEF